MAAATINICDDTAPGITRRQLKRGWAYHAPDGTRITDRDEIERLNAIGLPPAYESAWFSTDPDAHLLATGIDARGRKQYRYHPGFREARDAVKYEGCARFGHLLPRLRARVADDLRKRSLSRERAVAAVVRLLDLGRVRVGNDDYARTNKSFGATTLRKRHAAIEGQTLKLCFRAKSGKQRTLVVRDTALAGFARRCLDLPDQHLFAWLDDAGEPHPVTSSHVNAYIREAMGEDFTAKHFRTWGASVIAFEALASAPAPIGLKAVLEPVTDALGNTPAIARNSYVHPRLIDLAGDKAAQALFKAELCLPRATRYLTRMERGLIALLESDAPEAALAA